MKKAANPVEEEFIAKIPGVRVNSREKKALQAALKVLNEQSRRLGILDALDAEPAIVFSAEEGKR
jgi:hypothetical protein